jgi:predicted 3-demethylubiquinone-9 3-methyltransferase (glyoxalase superfamily)
MHKITPFLWFDDAAEEAAKFYVSIFPDSKVTWVTPGQSGKAQWVSFDLMGQPLYALNGGPMFKFTAAISLFVSCEDQTEVDKYWDALSEGGDPASQRCGWLKDKYGLSWQIIPKRFHELLADPDKDRAARVMSAMMKMKKLIVADLEAA